MRVAPPYSVAINLVPSAEEAMEPQVPAGALDGSQDIPESAER
jgi:hypothetical protein